MAVSGSDVYLVVGDSSGGEGGGCEGGGSGGDSSSGDGAADIYDSFLSWQLSYIFFAPLGPRKVEISTIVFE